MDFLIKEGNLNRYDKSKLIIEDQWASHPAIEDRIRELERINSPGEQTGKGSASGLFRNFEEFQVNATENLFSSISYSTPATFLGMEQFQENFMKEYTSGCFSRSIPKPSFTDKLILIQL